MLTKARLLGQKWVTILLAVEAALYLVFSPVFGIIADYTTARRVPYLVGLLLLAASVGLQTAAHSVAMYVAGRALQGASAAAVWVIGLALVVDTVDTNRVGEYFGYISWAMSFGALLGPILGGIVFEFGGYYVSIADSTLRKFKKLLSDTLFGIRAGTEVRSQFERHIGNANLLSFYRQYLEWLLGLLASTYAVDSR